jgi:hypothetical protein
MIAVMAEILCLQNLDPQAIYSMHDDVQPLSYNLHIFEFMAHLAMRNPHNLHLVKLTVDSLDYLRIEDVA